MPELNPSAIQGIYQYQVTSAFDAFKPEHLNKLFSRYGDQGMDEFRFLKTMGWEKEVSNHEYGHWEEGRIIENFQVRSNVSDPGAGNSADITLALADLDDNNKYYPRLNDEVLFANDVVGLITAIDVGTPAAPVVTVAPVDSSENIGALTASDYVVIFSNAFADGTDQPAGRVKKYHRYTNNLQIIKETVGAHGTDLIRQKWFDVTSEGQSIPTYYSEGLLDVDYRMSAHCSHVLLVGKKTTNSSLVDATTGEPVRTTEGLIPYVKAEGLTHPTNTFGMGDFDTIDRYLEQQHVGTNVLVNLGINRYQQVEDAIKEYLDTNGTDYTQKVLNDQFGLSQASAATVNFKSFSKSGRNYMLRKMSSFSNPKLLGSSGFDYVNKAVFIPMNKQKDAKTGAWSSSMGYRYGSFNGYNRRMEMWSVAGAGNELKVSSIDRKDTYMRAHIGAHFMGGNRFVLVESA